MKLGKPSVWRIVVRLIPIVRMVVEAAHPGSAGGKRITPAERQNIIGRALVDVADVIDEELA